MFSAFFRLLFLSLILGNEGAESSSYSSNQLLFAGSGVETKLSEFITDFDVVSVAIVQSFTGKAQAYIASSSDLYVSNFTGTGWTYPALIAVRISVTKIAGGLQHVLFITAENLYAMGMNDYGELGTGDTIARTSPTMIEIPDHFTPTKVAASNGGRSSFITASGILFSWGANSEGNLMLGDNFNRATPTAVVLPIAGETVTNIAAGQNFTVLISSLGSVYTAGQNNNCQLGLRDLISRNTPTLLFPKDTILPEGVLFLTCGYRHALATPDGSTVYGWGDNTNGQLLVPPTPRLTPSIILSSGGKNIRAFLAGAAHSGIIVRNSSGISSLFVGGRNAEGQLATGDVKDRSTATQVSINLAFGTDIPFVATASDTATMVVTGTTRFNTPTVTPQSGQYELSVGVTVSSFSAVYTTDGSRPTAAATPYKDPIIFTNASTFVPFQAMVPVSAVLGIAASYVARQDYEIRPRTLSPLIHPNGGVFFGSVTITLTGQETGEIRYSTDGTSPLPTSAVYSAPFSITLPAEMASFTLIAVALAPNKISSNFSSVEFTEQVAPVAFSPTAAAANFISVGEVSLSTNTSGAFIVYTFADIVSDANFVSTYTNAIPLTTLGNVSIFARATYSEKLPADWVSASYFVHESCAHGSVLGVGGSSPGVNITATCEAPCIANAFDANPTTLASSGRTANPMKIQIDFFSPTRISAMKLTIDPGTVYSYISLDAVNVTGGETTTLLNLAPPFPSASPVLTFEIPMNVRTTYLSYTVTVAGSEQFVAIADLDLLVCNETTPAPHFQPVGGEYADGVSVILTGRWDSMISYRLSAAGPWLPYTTPITLAPTIFNFIVYTMASSPGMSPAFANATYTILPRASVPTFSPTTLGEPTVIPVGQKITVLTDTPNAIVTVNTSTGVFYLTAGSTFILNRSDTVVASAISNVTARSQSITIVFTVLERISPPILHPAGGIFTSPITISVTPSNTSTISIQSNITRGSISSPLTTYGSRLPLPYSLSLSAISTWNISAAASAPNYYSSVPTTAILTLQSPCPLCVVNAENFLTSPAEYQSLFLNGSATVQTTTDVLMFFNRNVSGNFATANTPQTMATTVTLTSTSFSASNSGGGSSTTAASFSTSTGIGRAVAPTSSQDTTSVVTASESATTNSVATRVSTTNAVTTSETETSTDVHSTTFSTSDPTTATTTTVTSSGQRRLLSTNSDADTSVVVCAVRLTFASSHSSADSFGSSRVSIEGQMRNGSIIGLLPADSLLFDTDQTTLLLSHRVPLDAMRLAFLIPASLNSVEFLRCCLSLSVSPMTAGGGLMMRLWENTTLGLTLTLSNPFELDTTVTLSLLNPPTDTVLNSGPSVSTVVSLMIPAGSLTASVSLTTPPWTFGGNLTRLVMQTAPGFISIPPPIPVVFIPTTCARSPCSRFASCVDISGPPAGVNCSCIPGFAGSGWRDSFNGGCVAVGPFSSVSFSLSSSTAFAFSNISIRFAVPISTTLPFPVVISTHISPSQANITAPNATLPAGSAETSTLVTLGDIRANTVIKFSFSISIQDASVSNISILVEPQTSSELVVVSSPFCTPVSCPAPSSMCRQGNDSFSCTCVPGFFGDGVTHCTRESDVETLTVVLGTDILTFNATEFSRNLAAIATVSPAAVIIQKYFSGSVIVWTQILDTNWATLYTNLEADFSRGNGTSRLKNELGVIFISRGAILSPLTPPPTSNNTDSEFKLTFEAASDASTATTVLIASTIAVSAASSVSLSLAATVAPSLTGTAGSSATGSMASSAGGAFAMIRHIQFIALTSKIGRDNSTVTPEYSSFGDSLAWVNFHFNPPWNSSLNRKGSVANRRLLETGELVLSGGESFNSTDRCDTESAVRGAFLGNLFACGLSLVVVALLRLIFVGIAKILWTRRQKKKRLEREAAEESAEVGAGAAGAAVAAGGATPRMIHTLSGSHLVAVATSSPSRDASRRAPPPDLDTGVLSSTSALDLPNSRSFAHEHSDALGAGSSGHIWVTPAVAPTQLELAEAGRMGSAQAFAPLESSHPNYEYFNNITNGGETYPIVARPPEISVETFQQSRYNDRYVGDHNYSTVQNPTENSENWRTPIRRAAEVELVDRSFSSQMDGYVDEYVHEYDVASPARSPSNPLTTTSVPTESAGNPAGNPSGILVTPSILSNGNPGELPSAPNADEKFETPLTLCFPRWELTTLKVQYLGLIQSAALAIGLNCDGWRGYGLALLLLVPIPILCALVFIVTSNVLISQSPVCRFESVPLQTGITKIRGFPGEMKTAFSQPTKMGKLKGVGNAIKNLYEGLKFNGDWDPVGEKKNKYLFFAFVDPAIGDYRAGTVRATQTSYLYFAFDMIRAAVTALLIGIAIGERQTIGILAVHVADAAIFLTWRPYRDRTVNFVEGVSILLRIVSLVAPLLSSQGKISAASASVAMFVSNLTAVGVHMFAQMFGFLAAIPNFYEKIKNMFPSQSSRNLVALTSHGKLVADNVKESVAGTSEDVVDTSGEIIQMIRKQTEILRTLSSQPLQPAGSLTDIVDAVAPSSPLPRVISDVSDSGALSDVLVQSTSNISFVNISEDPMMPASPPAQYDWNEPRDIYLTT